MVLCAVYILQDDEENKQMYRLPASRVSTMQKKNETFFWDLFEIYSQISGK